MSEAWKNWEGQVVDNRFPLRQLLGESGHSAVFLTERLDRGGAKAAIKLVAAGGSAAEERLLRWRQVARLSHPNILPLYHYGKCQLGGLDLLFAVMEFADETLAEILPQRALSAEEARQMLEPALSGLVFLHQQGLVHGDIQPANIFAVGETIKLSSDTIRSISASGTDPSLHVTPDARPSEHGSVEPAGDIYSLGITIVQALTQRSPFDAGTSLGQAAEPLPAPFADIVAHALHPDAQLRWTAADIAARLNPAAMAAAAASTPIAPQRAPAKSEPKQERPAPGTTATTPPARPRVAAESPISVPLSPVTPLAKQARSGPPQTSSLLRYAAPIAVAVILLFMASRVFHRGGGSSAADSTIAKSAPVLPAAAATSAKPSAPAPQSTTVAPPPQSRPAEHVVTQPAPKKVPASRVAAAAPAKVPAQKSPVLASNASDKPEAAPVTMRSETRPAVSASSASPEVLQQVLPDVSQKALSTIHGTVRLTVRAQVDAQGKVADAQLATPSGSTFFNDLALKAARRWQFQPSDSAGSAAARAYLLRFEFTQGGPKASLTPTR